MRRAIWAGSCFPPIPGLGSWLMRRDTSGLEQEFQNWIAPYVQEDALNSTMYVDCAHHAMGVGNVLRYGLRGLQRAGAGTPADGDGRGKADISALRDPCGGRRDAPVRTLCR